MSFSLNKVMLIGNLGNDAEHRFTTNNTAISTFSLATTESYKNQSGEWVSKTTWHNCTGWKLSDYFKDRLKKGTKVYVEGKISKNDYTDKDGIKRYNTNVVVKEIIFLDGGTSKSADLAEEEINNSQDNQGKPAEDDDLPF